MAKTDWKIKYVEGNMLDMLQNYDVAMQGCNCFHMQGAGIAGQFASRYPQVLQADIDQTILGDKYKLGTYSKATVGNATVLNCYTQYHGGKHFDYLAFGRVLKRVKNEFSGKRIVMPLIGCGIAGADIDTIKLMITNHLINEDVTVVIFSNL